MLALDFQSLVHIIHCTQLSEEEDAMCWRWDPKGSFSTHATYNFLAFRGIQVIKTNTLWKLGIQHKIKAFMWLMMHNRILTKENLSKKGWQGNTYCIFCGQLETCDHLFCNCSYMQHIWFWLGESQEHFQHWYFLWPT
ncbi:hypothetical protein LUZ62_054170 [Rhynchospora pubera]|uniref:Reverse transcriptase zinc-binding domain-containing protein n=1 Tax=Rhynchospora pubera TaxID=906938 RepID=A0AAV8DUE4_9POAL|nr:hypothetical protein LUZ62_054170 [Rhynchospora pubera]